MTGFALGVVTVLLAKGYGANTLLLPCCKLLHLLFQLADYPVSLSVTKRNMK